MERALVGAMLQQERPLTAGIEAGVMPAWFTSDDCRALWFWAVMEFSDGKPIDLMTAAAVCRGKVLPAWPKWLNSAYEEANAAHAEYYIREIRASWLKREAAKLIETLKDDVQRAENPDEFVLSASERFRNLGGRDNRTKKTLSAIAADLVADWKNPKRKTGLPWPISGLNDGIGRVTDELIFLAAKESLGKSALALQWAVSLAWGGHTVSIRTMESATIKLVQRLISTIGRVNTQRLRNRQGTPDELRFADTAVSRIAEVEKCLRVHDGPANMNQLKAWGLMEKHRGSEFLIVDNMKHIRPDQKYDSPVQQFRDISQRLKWMRDDVGLPILVLHHTNEGGDVSWSRDIRRDVDILIVMTEDEEKSIKASEYNGYQGKRVINFDVQKNREGAAGFQLANTFRGDIQTFVIEEAQERSTDGLDAENYGPGSET